MDGYGNDTTASDSGLQSVSLDALNNIGYTAPSASTPSDSSGTAQALAQIFSTGVTAYVDSQAIQRGYSINNPQYYAAGYPGGVSNTYGATPQGASIVPPSLTSGTSGIFLLPIVGVVAFALLRKG